MTTALEIRDARPSDAAAIADLFRAAYGDDYAFPEYYEPDAVRRMIYDDERLMLVAVIGGEVVGTGSMLLATGDHDDLIALFGRLVVRPSAQGQGVARALVEARAQRVRGVAHFAYFEARTAHVKSQKLWESLGYVPIGFQPLICAGEPRESRVLEALVLPDALPLRRGSPRIIPEVARLAHAALSSLGLPNDVVVDDDAEGFSTVGAELRFATLDASSFPPLIRIARGRSVGREVFGRLSLSGGMAKLPRANSYYIVARHLVSVVGGVGWSWDPLHGVVRIFELIGLEDGIRGALLAELDRKARDELGAAYVHIDISAHARALQRTLERLGFAPVAYMPAMVFEAVERIDVVQMAKLHVPYRLGPVQLLPRAQEIRDIVEQGLDERLSTTASFEGLARIALFADLGDGERFAIARLATLERSLAGVTLITSGAPSDALLVLLEGEATVLRDGASVGTVKAGEVFGEMGLVTPGGRRTATVVATTGTTMLRLETTRLVRALEARPRTGHLVMRNLARSIAEKLLER